MQHTHPLNVLKFCPKCSSSDFKQTGDRSLKCGSCGFHYYVNSSAAVAGLVSDNHGRLMLVTRGIEPHYGMFDLPGGFIEPLETAENAIVRELYEELGLKTKSLHFLGTAPNEYVFSGFSVFTLDLAFRIIPESIEGLKPMDDILDYRFYAENEIDYKKIPAPSIQQFVKQFFGNESNQTTN